MRKRDLTEACEEAHGICQDCELAHRCKERDSEAETNSAEDEE